MIWVANILSKNLPALLRRQMGQCNDGDLAFYESRNDSGKRGEILAGQELDAFKLPS